MRAGRVVTGVNWVPTLVRFAHAGPPNAREHAGFFGAPVLFGTGENVLELDAAVLDLPCVRSDPTLVAVLDRYASDQMNKVPPTASLSGRIRKLLEDELRGGEPTAQHSAEQLKMRVRTLNRQLAAQNTSFRQVLDQLRHELATKYLTGRHLSVGEVAFLVGFSELSSFHRAFKRWTGVTPGRFRQRLRSDPPS